MTALAIEVVTTSHGADDDELDHLYCCCAPDLGLCGADLSGTPECTDECDGLQCLVCDDLMDLPCSRCGYTIEGPCACGGCER